MTLIQPVPGVRPPNNADEAVLGEFRNSLFAILLFGGAAALNDPPPGRSFIPALSPDTEGKWMQLLYEAKDLGLLSELEFEIIKVSVDIWSTGGASKTNAITALHCAIETVMEELEKMSGHVSGLAHYANLART